MYIYFSDMTSHLDRRSKLRTVKDRWKAMISH